MEPDNLPDILELLKRTKTSPILTNPSTSMKWLLAHHGIKQEGEIIINREDRMALATAAVLLRADIEEVVQHLNWKDFEGFVARILVENNYSCVESFRRRGNAEIKGMEIDVIGLKNRTLLVIDAKMWGVRSGKASALRTAIDKQKERTDRLSNQLDRLAKKMTKLKAGTYELLPIMVTWLVEDIEIHEGVPVVPIFLLNSFLLNIADYEDLIDSFKGHLSDHYDQQTL